VRLWLAQKEHLTSVRFVTAGYGASRPVAPNSNPDGSDDPAGRQRNRRVELVLLKR
jgi:outer membrane protein OmpA-like peptidoglycan-associated protein